LHESFCSYNEKDLSDTVKSGKVKGAAIDVFAKESPEDLDYY
jgi:phosphoglycerate dehydrogenase-like enzyme